MRGDCSHRRGFFFQGKTEEDGHVD
jgi:hypothetical protein